MRYSGQNSTPQLVRRCLVSVQMVNDTQVFSLSNDWVSLKKTGIHIHTILYFKRRQNKFAMASR